MFLGTPFHGSWQTGTQVAERRIEQAKQAKPEDNIQYSRELVQYLKLGTKDHPSPLDNLIHRFQESMNNPKYTIPRASLYELRPTNFAAPLSRLPIDVDQTGVDKHGKALVSENHESLSNHSLIFPGRSQRLGCSRRLGQVCTGYETQHDAQIQ